MSLAVGDKITLRYAINQTDLLAPVIHEIVSPLDGYLVEHQTIVQAAVTTGGTLTVKTGAALATTVAGLTDTIANAAAKGAVGTVKSATAKSATRRVLKGDRIGIVPAGFATAGAVSGHVVIATSDSDPAL